MHDGVLRVEQALVANAPQPRIWRPILKDERRWSGRRCRVPAHPGCLWMPVADAIAVASLRSASTVFTFCQGRSDARGRSQTRARELLSAARPHASAAALPPSRGGGFGAMLDARQLFPRLGGCAASARIRTETGDPESDRLSSVPPEPHASAARNTSTTRPTQGPGSWPPRATHRHKTRVVVGACS